MLVTRREERAEMLVNILQCTEHPPVMKNHLVQMSVVPRLRNSALGEEKEETIVEDAALSLTSIFLAVFFL